MPENPKGYRGSEDFQTKDLGQTMSVFEIREDGTLWKENVEYDWKPGDPNAKDWLDKLPTAERISSEWAQQKITDTINLCDYIISKDDLWDYWIDYEVVFVDGIVKSAKIIEFRAEDNLERKIHDEKFQEEMRRQHKFQQTRQYKYLVKPYRATINYLFRKISKILNYLSSNIWRVERFLKG